MIAHLPPYRVEAVTNALPSSGIDWSLHAYAIPALWQRHQGAGIRVGVLDTGIVPGHPALEGAVLEHRNFTSDSSPYDTVGHGTHVAGIVAGRGMVKGIAPGCEIISCKVLGHSGAGSMESISRAVWYATERHWHILVMSLGAPADCGPLHEAIKAATKSGVTIVCAAGNDGGSVNYPAAYSETVAVGAVDKDGRACEFSCRGREIDVAAPGCEIVSAWLDGGVACLSGTSMAAPFVAGVLALARGACGAGAGSSANDIIRMTSMDVGAPGLDEVYGWGLINPASIVSQGCRAIV